jgi:hypothetical protein
MAVSQVHLANTALAKLVRDGNLQSLDEKGSNAKYMKQFMEDAIHEFIEEYDWPQCRIVKALNAVPDIDSRGWSAAYEIPSDCVKVWRVNDTDPELAEVITWEMGMSVDLSSTTNYIFTNDSGMNLRYGSSRVSLERFSPQQRDLIATKLAIKTCLLITKDKNLRKDLEAGYARDLSKVKTAYANMEPELFDSEFTPETISVR